MEPISVVMASPFSREPASLQAEAGRLVRRAATGGQASAACIPGLVNSHDHLHLNAFPRPPVGHVRDAADWIVTMAELQLTPEYRAVSALAAGLRAWHGGLKNLLSGATTVLHHDPWQPEFANPDFPVQVVPEYGWAHSLSMAGRYGPTIPAGLAATPPGAPFVVHAAEGIGTRAARELPELTALGAVNSSTRLVHLVGARAADAERAASARARMIWCPASNLTLFGVAADPAAFLPDRVSLGTDSRLTGTRDILEELRLAAGLGAPARMCWHMVAGAGAAACGLPVDVPEVGAPVESLVGLPPDADPATWLTRSERADLEFVISRGRPAVADPRWQRLFTATDTASVHVRLDGREKLLAEWVLGPPGAAELEPGLDLSRARRSVPVPLGPVPAG